MSTKPEIHILPRVDGGYRACAAAIPGCVVIHKDPEKAAELVKQAVRSLIKEESEDCNGNEN